MLPCFESRENILFQNGLLVMKSPVCAGLAKYFEVEFFSRKIFLKQGQKWNYSWSGKKTILPTLHRWLSLLCSKRARNNWSSVYELSMNNVFNCRQIETTGKQNTISDAVSRIVERKLFESTPFIVWVQNCYLSKDSAVPVKWSRFAWFSIENNRLRSFTWLVSLIGPLIVR